MNKTISINLSGMLFNLEEAAYEKLSQYLRKVKASVHQAEGHDEIIGDIESRIAELFQEKLRNRQVVLTQDVDEVIEVMGQPEDYAEANEEPAAEASEKNQTRKEEPVYNGPKRLFRSPDEGMVAGVCVGLGHYFGVDPVWLRIAFLATFLFAGGGALVYIILWIVLPKAETTADKLQMKGEPVTISNIEKSIREEMNRLQAKSGQFARQARSGGNQVGNFVQEVSESLVRLLNQFVSFMGKSLGIFFLALGGILLLGWLTVVLSGGYGINISTEEDFGNFSIPAFFGVFFSSANYLKVFLIGLSLFTLAPIVGLLLAGLRLLTPKGFTLRWPAAINGSLFTIGLIIMVVMLALTLTEFKSRGKLIEPVGLVQPIAGDTLEVKILQESLPQLKHNLDFEDWKFYMEEDEPPFMIGEVGLDVRKAENDQVRMSVTKTARGKDKKTAIQTAALTSTYAKQEGNTIWLNSHFALKKGSQWRNQVADFSLQLPEGSLVRFHPGTSELFTDVANVQNLEGEEIEMEVWKMGKDGLECVSCVAQTAQ